jgi:tape measure domain-containing protein
MAGTAVTNLQVLVNTPGVEKLPQLASSLKRLTVSTKEAGLSFTKLSAGLKKQQVEGGKSINNTRALANSWKQLAASVKFGSKEFEVATARAKRLNTELMRMEGRKAGGMGRMARTAGAVAGAGVFGGPEGAIGAAIGGLMPGGGPISAAVGGAIGAQVGMVRQAVGSTATYAADIKKQRLALKLVIGDNERYEKSLKFIEKTSKELAIPQEVITRQFTQLSASVLGAGSSMDDAEDSFLAVTSGIRGTGGSIQDMNAALTATSQVWSKGKVSAEELRQQLGERLPGAFTIFAASMNKTPAELDKALEQGKVTLSDFLGFTESLIDQYGEKAVMIAQSTFAAGDRMETALSKLKESMGTLIQPIGAQIQEFMTGGIEALDIAVRSVLENMPELLRFTGELLKITIAYASVWAVVTGAKGLKAAIELARKLLSIERIMTGLARARLNIEAAIATFKTAPGGPLAKLLLTGGAAVGVYVGLDSLIKESIKSIQELYQEIDLIGDVIGGKVKNKVEDLGETSKSVWAGMKAGAKSYLESIKDVSKQIEDATVNAFKSMEDSLVNFVTTGKMNFADFARSVIADLTRIAVRQAMLNVLSPIPFFGNLFKNEKGNVYAQNAIVPFAQGGVFNSPHVFPFKNGVGLMAEAGPEAIMPLRRGPGGRLGVEATGGAGDIIINVDAGRTTVQGDDDKGRQLGSAISAAVQAELVKQKMPGGLLYA